nr:WhiB family transcriptional regulator [Rhodococcus sp. P1Y]
MSSKRRLTVELPAAVIEHWDWQLRGACRRMPVVMFFPEQDFRGHALTRAEHTAKLVCAQCPVADRCREHAMSVNEPFGIWGGTTALERSVAREALERRSRNPRRARSVRDAARSASCPRSPAAARRAHERERPRAGDDR